MREFSCFLSGNRACYAIQFVELCGWIKGKEKSELGIWSLCKIVVVGVLGPGAHYLCI